LNEPNDEYDDGVTRPGKKGLSRFYPQNIRTFTSLKNPVFRLYYMGILGQRASMNMQLIARSLLVWRITGSGTILGLMQMFNALPILFLSLFGGILSDRIQKKYIILVGLVVSAAVSLSVALSLTFGYLSVDKADSWWILGVTSLLQGCVMGLMVPSRQAIIPEMVSDEDLMNAVSLDSLGMNVLRLTAPALTGFIIAGFDFAAVYYAMTAMYAIGAVFISFMPLTRRLVSGGNQALADIAGGFKYLKRNPTISILLIFTLFVVVLSMPYMALLPIFTDTILGVGASGMGVLVSISGFGAMVGALVFASLPNRKRGLMLISGCLILGLALIGFSFSDTWTASLILIIFVGLGQTARMTLGNTLIQYYVDDEYRGRVLSIYVMEFGLTSFGSAGAGVLSDAIGAPWALGSFAIALAVISFLTLLFVPRLRNLD